MTDLATRAAAARQSRTPSARAHVPVSAQALVDTYRDRIAQALPSHVDVDRFLRVLLTEVRRTPKLGECTAESLVGSWMLTAQVGLLPGPGYGHVYLVPRKNKNTGRLEVEWQVGYRGMIELARRAGAMVEAHTVHAGDGFWCQYGAGDHGLSIVHRPELDSDRGAVVASWAKVRHGDGLEQAVVLGAAELESRAQRSDAYRGGWGPWVTDRAAMARKSAVRKLEPYLPRSAEFADALAADEGVATVDAAGDVHVTAEHADDEPDMPGEVINADVVEVAEVAEAAAKPARKRGARKPADPPADPTVAYVDGLDETEVDRQLHGYDIALIEGSTVDDKRRTLVAAIKRADAAEG